MAIDVKYLNPFIKGSMQILKTACYEDSTLGKLYLKGSNPPGDRVIIVIGVTGDIRGQIIFNMKESVGCYLAGKMMGTNLVSLDEMSKSAISELANMIVGTTSTLLFSDKIFIDITPPSILTGINMRVSVGKELKTICIPLALSNGMLFEIDVAIK